MRLSILAGFSTIIISAAALAGADGHASDKMLKSAVEARQAHMDLFAFNLSTLGAMAKGEVDYDAAAASVAAGNLAALASMDQSTYWLPGSDSDSVEGSRALPVIWTADSKIGERGAAFAEAVSAMETAAGTDLASLQAAMGDLGKSCGGCHDDYRKPRD